MVVASSDAWPEDSVLSSVVVDEFTCRCITPTSLRVGPPYDTDVVSAGTDD